MGKAFPDVIPKSDSEGGWPTHQAPEPARFSPRVSSRSRTPKEADGEPALSEVERDLTMRLNQHGRKLG
jgi:hypothetical protein